MRSIWTDNAPAPVGPYSQAVEAGGFLYLSGQIGMGPGGGEMASDIRGQAAQVFRNIGAVLEAAGLGPSDVVKVNAYLADMDDFKDFNDAYSDFFGEHRPARAAIQAARLPLDALIEVEAVARAGE
jgi:2-iminobutanoate/2-iminopropanoate deaminase